jgi:hypothetical protein
MISMANGTTLSALNESPYCIDYFFTNTYTHLTMQQYRAEMQKVPIFKLPDETDAAAKTGTDGYDLAFPPLSFNDEQQRTSANKSGQIEGKNYNNIQSQKSNSNAQKRGFLKENQCFSSLTETNLKPAYPETVSG